MPCDRYFVTGDLSVPSNNHQRFFTKKSLADHYARPRVRRVTHSQGSSAAVSLWLSRFPVIVISSFLATLLCARSAVAQGEKSPRPEPGEARIELWNRLIAWQRGTLGGVSAQERAYHASERLDALPLSATVADIALRPVEIDDRHTIAFTCKGQILFFLGSNDLDKESNETLEQISQTALQNLDEALKARIAERSWPVIRAAILFTATGLFLFIFLSTAIWKVCSYLASFLGKWEASSSMSFPVFGLNLLPGIFAVSRSLVRLGAFVLTLAIFYLWVALSLRRFPYTEPWGDQAGTFVVDLLREFLSRAARALPGLVAVFFVFLVTRWLVRLSHGLFEQIATGRINIPWMDADVARATQRIFAVVAYTIAIVVAYPYFPGSQTDAFKGVSVFIGLVISLGSTGIINQIMSGLFVVYSKALKTGEWVKVGDTEGEVLDVGLLAAKIRTIEGQEVTIPNSLLVGSSTMNFTRLGVLDGMIISATVTVGYDAPWRQVHALLLRAAGRTTNVRQRPEPYVLQRQLSDFYVEYTLLAHLDDPKLRMESISELHAHIQDAFNEFGVQIMSPHYMMQPQQNVTVPPAKWHPPPADPKS
jgi:small-conductance mechanosensitive channel